MRRRTNGALANCRTFPRRLTPRSAQRLEREARERLRAKFGDSGLSAVGSPACAAAPQSGATGGDQPVIAAISSLGCARLFLLVHRSNHGRLVRRSTVVQRLREQDIPSKFRGMVSPATTEAVKESARNTWSWLSSSATNLMDKASTTYSQWSASSGGPQPQQGFSSFSQQQQQQQQQQQPSFEHPSVPPLEFGARRSAVDDDWLQREIAAAQQQEKQKTSGDRDGGAWGDGDWDDFVSPPSSTTTPARSVSAPDQLQRPASTTSVPVAAAAAAAAPTTTAALSAAAPAQPVAVRSKSELSATPRPAAPAPPVSAGAAAPSATPTPKPAVGSDFFASFGV
jgi:hypothetical protein